MNKKVFILGSTGMAGQVITKYLRENTEYNILEISRSKGYICDIINQEDMFNLESLIKTQHPDYIINCIGLLIKECNNSKIMATYVNAEFPHIIARWADAIGSKVIHISTDCVFDGKNGPYREDNFPTETSNYGVSKVCGEIKYMPHLTLRTSIIGPDTDINGPGLFNWITHQKGEVKGFSSVQWNGITTLELAKQIHNIIETCPTLSGLYHLTTDFPVSKFSLLYMIKCTFNVPVTIIEDDSFVQNKCLINNRKGEYDCRIPPLSIQLTELYNFIN